MTQDGFRGALLGTFTGDALGMPLEDGRPGGDVREMLDARRGHGTNTDDTQLMIALAEALLETPGRLDLDADGFLAELRPRAPEEYHQALDWMGKHREADPAAAAYHLGTTVAAHRSVPFALWCFLTSEDDPEEAITRAINQGGDTDTLGAMTGAVAGAFCGASRLPARWLEALENGDKGRDDVVELADRLWASRGFP